MVRQVRPQDVGRPARRVSERCPSAVPDPVLMLIPCVNAFRPGSQNGFDHSGRLGGSHFASKQSYIDRTLAIIETMAQEFAKAKYANTVTMIE